MIYLPISIDSVDRHFDDIEQKTLDLLTKYENLMLEEDAKLTKAGVGLKGRGSARLHSSKFYCESVLVELVRKGLVKRVKTVIVEKQIALKYMSS
ncbi:hypothetical protein A9488_08860 [Bacillus cereus]|uniref:hypothetical protein n=1 Tax=Bacillus cereus TaxID=1396 RepID=UPI0008FDDB1F|nr:hypothetical protein [Bacillus cereus]MDN4100457.1 hypothetical protein [Bacillus cereus]OJE14566.1 hypothetical protein A9488_08860 [Bacillus cereus]